MNFVATRPLEEIAREYVEAFCALYDPNAIFGSHLSLFLDDGCAELESSVLNSQSWWIVKALLIVIWRQGIKRETRWKFWHHLFSILKRNPGVFEHYLSVCAHNEHFLEYRQIVRDEIEAQLAEFLAEEAKHKLTEAEVPAKLAS